MEQKRENFTFFSKNSSGINFYSKNSHLNSIEFTNNGKSVELKGRDGEIFSFNETDKVFETKVDGMLVEKVIEYSGLATDGIEKESWAIVYFPQGGYSPNHHHAERTEIYYITRGNARLVIDGKEHHLKPGDSMTIEPYQKHQIFNTGKVGDLVILVECTPAWVYTDVHTDEITSKPSATI